MKKIEAIIKPFKLDEVKEALQEVGIQAHHRHRSEGLWPAEGPCRALSRSGIHRGLPPRKVKIEIVVGDDLIEKAIDAIRRAAQTGRIGDGKIFVSNIEEAIRIRTGESGLDAI